MKEIRESDSNHENHNSSKAPTSTSTSSKGVAPKKTSVKSLQTKLEKANIKYDKLKKNFDEFIGLYTKCEGSLTSIQNVYNDIKINYEKVLEERRVTSPDRKNSQYLDTDLQRYRMESNSDTNRLDTNMGTNYKNKNILDKDIITINIKKLEEFENSYNDMAKNFNLLTLKYKLLKDETSDKDKIVNRQQKEIDQLKTFNKDLKKEMNEYNIKNCRLRDLNRCLIEENKKSYIEVGGINNIHYNSNNILLSEELEDKNVATHIEPMPSFLKFLEEAS